MNSGKRTGREAGETFHQEEYAPVRRPEGLGRHAVPVIGVAWSLFQLSVASWWIMDSVTVRSVHLAFALLIAFLSYPAFRKTKTGMLAFLSRIDRISVFDWLVALIAAAAAFYIVIDYTGIAGRQGAPIPRDVAVGVTLMVLLLEATRRAVGPALPVIAVCFCLYSFLGPHMPDFLASKGVSLNRFIGQMTMSTEGIYGIPLNVSATVVFLFVLFGAMLERAGAGQYFISLALSMLGRFRGGPAKAAILGSALTGLFSGSSIANIVTTGTFTIPLMKRVGYPPKKAAAIEVAASTDGQLMPPIMGAAAFIIAEYVNVPYIEVAKAAAIPAFASYCALFFITHLEACKIGLKGMDRRDLPPFWSTLKQGLHFLIPLALLLYLLIVVRRSPEFAAFYAVCAMALVMLLFPLLKALKEGRPVGTALWSGFRQLLDSMANGARNMVGVALATAAAGIIVGVVTMGLGGLVTEIIDYLSGGNLFLMLFITALASLLMGMGLPTTATYIVMASLTAKALVNVAELNGFFMPLMAAHLFCFYFGILADDTPPVGLAAYTAAAIAKAPPVPTGLQGFAYDLRTAIIPFMFVFNTDIILHNITSWPLGLLIFAMTAIGACAFASATQGWFVAKNRWYEAALLLLTTFIMMRPDLPARLLAGENLDPHAMYLAGLAPIAGVYLLQRPRREPS